MTTAAALDAADDLAGFAAEFAKPPGVYLDGNSLGLLCHAAEATLREAVEAWRALAIRGWTEGSTPWFGMAREAAARLAPLLGCDPADVMVGNSTTVNLHQLLATFRGLERPFVVIDGTHFPTDRYAAESNLRLSGGTPDEHLVVVPPEPDRLLDEDRLIPEVAELPCLAVLPSVVYTTGQLLDMKRVTGAVGGTLIAWDCSHSAGVVPHRFREDGIDLAFGCGYKYLNGGPGAAAWLYVHPRLRDRLPGLAGWFGCDPARQFEMAATFHPAADAGRFQIGTPHVFSLAPLLGSLAVLNDAGIDRIRAKSVAQTRFLIDLARERLGRHGVGIVTPADPARRGGHVTFTHPDAAKLSRALRARGVVPDFRPPDMLRFAPAPLYTSFAECQAAVDTLAGILADDAHHRLPDADDLVT
ncbi:MAG: kynureninase [Gemmataceae bacterium]|nr:kynureninase [Gemmataceae bacterium]